jgi:RNA polymerase sigma-70 factor (ECF subfamily)
VEAESLQDELIDCRHSIDPFRHWAEREAQAAIDEAIGRLPQASREAFVLVRVEGLSYREAAGLLEVPLGTLQSRLSNATQLMRRDLSCMRDATADSETPVVLKAGKENPDAL